MFNLEQEIKKANEVYFMTAQQFYDMCKDHDWTYMYSDDHSVWKAGKESEKELIALTKGKPEFQDIYDKVKNENGLAG